MITPSFSLTATERVLPRLALDFTTASLDPRVTFTRTGNTATVTNSLGLIAPINADLPRFDFDPITLACKGLLIEESRANSIGYSEDFANAYWGKASCTISSNLAVAPDGNTTADKLIMMDNVAPNTADGAGLIKFLTVTSSVYAYSIYAKAGEHTSMRVRENLSLGSFLNIDLLTGVTSVSGGGTQFTNIRSVNVGNGWWRISWTTPTMTATNKYSVRSGVTGDGTSGFYIWGYQIEAGAFPTSYIPTTSAVVTRNTDIATITDTNFSDFWQASKGGAQAQAIPSTVSGIRPLVQYDDGTSDNIIALRGNAANPELQIVNGGAPQVQLDAGTIVANTPYSLTGWWQTNDCKARQNSGATVSDYTATIPTVTQARLGSDGTNYLNGHLATINYYDSFLGQSIYTRSKNKVFASLL